jgi:hypothetical protein
MAIVNAPVGLRTGAVPAADLSPATTNEATPSAAVGRVDAMAPSPERIKGTQVKTAVSPLSPAAVTASRALDELRIRVAKQIVAKNPSLTYTGKVPDILAAIPVLQIELDARGDVKDISVFRAPNPDSPQETIQIAMDAVRRAAPFDMRGMFSAKFLETFLFKQTTDNQLKFKPRSLE